MRERVRGTAGRIAGKAAKIAAAVAGGKGRAIALEPEDEPDEDLAEEAGEDAEDDLREAPAEALAAALPASGPRRWVVPAGGVVRLDRALAVAFPDLSRTRIQALIAEGQVLVNGAPAGKQAPAGAEVVLTVPAARPTALVPEDIPLRVLYQDADLVVLDKPAGLVVHPGAGHAQGTLVHALLHHLGALSTIGGEERPGIVHRLDVGTSGVMVVACNDEAHRALSEQFAVHSSERRYLALVHRVPLHDAGTIRSEIARDPADRLRFASRPGGRPAVTHWAVRARGDRVALVECRLETGRTHQVRVHLSEAGHPLLGDRTYTRRDCTPPAALRAALAEVRRPLLHAWTLAFDHPRTGERMRFSTPPPADFLEIAVLAGLAVPTEPTASPSASPRSPRALPND